MDGRDVIFDYISVETMKDDLEYLYGNRYQFAEDTLEKAKDYALYKMNNPYNTELVIDSLIDKGILN